MDDVRKTQLNPPRFGKTAAHAAATMGARDRAAERELLPLVLPPRWERRATGGAGVFYVERGGLAVIASVDVMPSGRRWFHVSTSRRDRMPTWDDLVAVKELFMGKERRAIQLLPAREDWINLHEFCLHIWSPLDGDDGLDEVVRGGVV